jgi:hypothetical protein
VGRWSHRSERRGVKKNATKAEVLFPAIPATEKILALIWLARLNPKQAGNEPCLLQLWRLTSKGFGRKWKVDLANITLQGH